MTGLFMKLFICPVVVLVADAILGSVNYLNIHEPVSVGLFLALVAHVSELFLLRKGTFWINNVVDFIAAFAIVYASQFYYPGAVITFTGALITAVLLTATEYLQHLYLIRTRHVGRV